MVISDQKEKLLVMKVGESSQILCAHIPCFLLAWSHIMIYISSFIDTGVNS